MDQVCEASDFCCGSPVEECRVFFGKKSDDFPDGALLFGGRSFQLRKGGIADSPGGIVDHSFEGFVVIGVDDHPEPGEQVFDLLTLVEGESAIDLVGNVSFAQGFFEDPGLGVGTVENGEIGEAEVVAQLCFGDDGRYPETLLVIGEGTDDFYRCSGFLFREDFLVDLSFVMGNDAVRRVDDGLCRAVVLFKLEYLEFGVVAAEAEDILDAGSPESVDALGIVAHHAYVVVLFCQPVNDQVLGIIGVLVFIDQNVVEFLLVAVQYSGVVAEQQVGNHKQVVEVHGIAQAAPLGVFLVEFTDLRHLDTPVVLPGLAVGGI